MCKNFTTAMITVMSMQPIHCGISLSGFPAEVEPGRTVNNLLANVTCTGKSPQGIAVTITADVEDHSGGHQHTLGRRPPHAGTVGYPKGNVTDANGAVAFTFTGPAPAGDHTITAKCVDGRCGETSGKVWVGVKGLAQLSGLSGAYRLVGDKPSHPDNHYLSGPAAQVILNIAGAYQILVQYDVPPTPVLHLNDASLERGGLFDIATTWQSPHQTHRFGVEIDVRANPKVNPGTAIPGTNFDDFETLLAEIGATRCPARAGPGYVGTDNQHYHVCLLGGRLLPRRKPMKLYMHLTTALIFLSVSICAAANEILTYDPGTGIYTVEYYNTYDQATPVLRRAQFELPTRIDPTISSKIKDAANGRTLYRYKISNGAASKQNLHFAQLSASHVYIESQITPTGWRGTTAPHYASGVGFLVSWSQLSRVGNGLKPGQSQGDFSFQSQDLPGVDAVRTKGKERRDLGGFPDLGPSSDTPVGQQFSDLMKKNESVPRLAAIPRISNPIPFNAVVVLGGIQQHIKTDMASMQLIDPTLLGLIDRSLTQAIAAAQGGNTSSLLHEIKGLRQLLKKEHADVDQDDDRDDDEKEKKPKVRIDKLAARVLDFDLEYVEKRVRGH